jgi:hypothetical protein
VRAIAYDRLIESCVAVPGAVATNDPADHSPDLAIRMLPTSRASGADEPIYRLDGPALLFSPPGIAIYRCQPDEIVISPLIGADADDVTALLVATALPATVWMLGDFVLHAAAVRLPGHERAVAFASSSGGGKSATAAALVERGADLVADDTVRICRRSDVPIASGLPGGWFAHVDGQQTRTFCAAPPDRTVRNCPLGAVVILTDDGPIDFLALLDPLEAVEQLLANCHRPRIPALLGRRPEALRFCSFLAQSIPVYVWRHSVDDGASEALMRCIAA